MRAVITLSLILLLTGYATALEIEPAYNTKYIVDELQNPIAFTLQIQDAPTGEYNVYTLADFTIEPSEIFTIPNGSMRKQFILTPNENFKADGTYTFTYTLHHRGIEKIEERFTLEVISLADIIRIGSESIDPTKGEVSFHIENTADVPITNVTAHFSSILFDIRETISLRPFEKKNVVVSVDATKLAKTKAGVYIIDSEFETKKGNVEISGNLYLGEKKGITTTEDSSGFIISTKTINKINSGNVLEDVEITMKKNIISRLFTSFNTEPHLVERGGISVEYTWKQKRLGPGEVYTIKSTTNYLFPFIIIILFGVAFMVLRRITQKKIDLTKTVHPVKTKNGEFALRVEIAIKAKTSLEEVTIIDKVPAMVKIHKKFNAPEPDKIDLESRRLHWKLGDLQNGEERILRYIVYSRVGYVGKFSLPAALAVYEKDEELHETESNRVFFMNDQIKEE